MKSKFIYISLFISWLLLGFPGHAAAKKDQGRVTFNMNTDWAFFRGDVPHGERVGLDDSRWMPAALPHVMQLEKKHCGGDGIYDGIGWYRRYFRLPEEHDGKRIVLSFEGVMNTCDVYLNGEKVTTHHGGYVGFAADLTGKVKTGGENNVLAVRVSAEYDPITPPGKPQGRLDFYYYSGIYRDVKMTVSDRLHITDDLEANTVAGGGVFVTYPEVSQEKALVKVQTQVGNAHPSFRKGKLQTLLRDKKGKVVASNETDFSLNASERQTLQQVLTVHRPALWHPYRPDLYTLESRVVCGKKVMDSRQEKVGIRTIEYTTDGGFFINGEHLYLVGANRHQSYPNVGDAASNSMQEREVIDMKRGGYNAVRAAHYPHDPAFLEACDKHGLLVVECIPGWQYFNDNPVFADRLEQVAREMVRRDRNRPSVILWETALNETTYPLEVVKRIYDAAHEEYPGNQFYTAGDYFGHEETEPYYDVFYKQVSRFPKDGSVMSNYLEDQIAVKPLFTREWGDGVGEKPRVSLAESEYEQMRQCRGRYHQLNGNGYFDWCMLDANPRMGGHFMWSYNDYNRGAEEHTMYSGVVDVNRAPKFGYYMMQSMRSKDISQPGLYEGPMVFVASHNSSAEYASATKAIMVFSNCDEVRLYRNGKQVGTQTREEAAKNYRFVVEKGGSPAFVFDAGGYEAGELKAEGLVDGKIVAVHRVQTPGAPARVVVEVPDHGVNPLADGSNMIPVYFKVCDGNGTLVHTSKAQINITVSGEGTLIGDGIRRIGINPQQVEGGIGFAFVRTTKRAGNIRISASAEGLQAGEAVVRSFPSGERLLPDGTHAPFEGNEEDGVIVKPTRWERDVLSKPKVKVAEVQVTSEQPGFGKEHITDGDDFSWWIAGEDQFPQTVTLVLEEPIQVLAGRVRFQKDSSSYTHRVEISEDGVSWTPVYERECTGWDFKPVRLNKKLKYFRVTVDRASEGRAGVAEITLYKE